MRGEGRWPGEAVQSFRGQGWPERTRRTLVSRGGARVRENGSQKTERGKRALGRADCGRVTGRHAGGGPHLPAGGEGKSASGWGCGAVTLTTSGQAGCWSRVPGPRRSPPGGHLLGDMASGPWAGRRVGEHWVAPSRARGRAPVPARSTAQAQAGSGLRAGFTAARGSARHVARRRCEGARVECGGGQAPGRVGPLEAAGGWGVKRRPGAQGGRAGQHPAGERLVRLRGRPRGRVRGVSLTSREVEAGGGGVHGEAHRTPPPVC